MVEKWSRLYENRLKTFSEATITLENWTLGYEFSKKTKKNISLSDDNSTSYYVAAGFKLDISQQDINCMKELAFSVWEIILPKDDNWSNGTCSCPFFMKNFMCKHLVGLAIRLKLVKPPVEAKNIPIGMKRQRGSKVTI